MSVVDLLPLTLVVLTLVAYLGAKLGGRIDRVVSRTARALFARFVSDNAERRRSIEAAYIDSTYRTYAAKTYLFTLLAFVGGGLAAAYGVAGTLLVLEAVVRKLSQLPNTISQPLGFTRDFELVLGSSLYWSLLVGAFFVFGIVLAVLAYFFRWKLPESDAEVRKRSINEGLPRTTAFMYALSRGGTSFPETLRVLSKNNEIYGESAKEFQVTVREMDLFGRDMITAIRRTAKRTPSDRFKTFCENLASVLQSGSSLPDFLDDQYSRFQEEAEERQEEVLELLATIAEGYVTVMVAGVLFLITILLVFGLTTTDTLPFLKLMAYVIVPLANAGFALFVAQRLKTLGVGNRSAGDVLDRMEVETPARASPQAQNRRADGGVAHDRQNREMLRWYDRVKRVKEGFRQPLRTVLWNPKTVLLATVPIALVAFLVRVPQSLTGTGLNLRIFDDLVIQSALLVLVTFGVVRELYKRRIDRIEAAVPELLERLASLNESGMSVAEGFENVRGGDLGVLTPEVDRIWRDIELGSNIGDALIRFGRRVRTTAITRVVVLLTNAMRASGDLAPVLRIAADQSRSDLELRRRRRRQMLTYLVVIYISFLVFLVIIVAVNQVLVPSLPESVPTPSGSASRLGVNVNQFTRFGEVDKAAYTLVFFHTALIQAVCSGFIAGQLGNGSLRDGAKHAAAMLTLAYIVFMLVSTPVASITASGAVSTGDTIRIETVSSSSGGFLVVREDNVNGTVLGRSSYIEAGTQQGVVVPLDRRLRSTRQVHITFHRDTNGNRAYDYEGPYLPQKSQDDGPYPSLSSSATPGVTVEVKVVTNGTDT